MPPAIRVYIIDGTRYQAEALGMLLAGVAGLELVGTGDDPCEALERVEAGQVDVLLVHAAGGGISVVRGAKERRPAQLVAVLGLNDDPEAILRAIEAGAGGYLLRDAGPDEVARVVEAMCAGQATCSP